MDSQRDRIVGIVAALLTPLFMGAAPIFGKLGLRSGIDPFSLTALRTMAAAALLWIVYAIFFRKFIYIFPAGLLGTAMVGVVNGVGSLLFYNGLLLLDNASLAQLLNMLYVVFVMILMRLYGGHISRLSLVRAGLALVAVYLLTMYDAGPRDSVHWTGVALMIGGAFMYGYHVVLSQRSMYEMPAPTMALYALTFMGLTVLVARLVVGGVMSSWGPSEPIGWYWLLGLTVVTALSRVTLFAGVRNLGAIPTILLNVAELGVTLLIGHLALNESFTPQQWVGVLVLLSSVLLAYWDSYAQDKSYRRLPTPAPLGGVPIERLPEPPKRFSTISRVFRRQPPEESPAPQQSESSR